MRQLHSGGIPLGSLYVVFISNASKQVWNSTKGRCHMPATSEGEDLHPLPPLACCLMAPPPLPFLKVVMQVPLWRQMSASAGSSSLVIWDYHVLVVEAKGSGAFIWDLDR